MDEEYENLDTLINKEQRLIDLHFKYFQNEPHVLTVEEMPSQIHPIQFASAIKTIDN